MQNLETEMAVFGQKFHELLNHCRNLEQQLREVREQKAQVDNLNYQLQQELEHLKRSYENKVEQYIASIDAILDKGDSRDNSDLFSHYQNN